MGYGCRFRALTRRVGTVRGRGLTRPFCLASAAGPAPTCRRILSTWPSRFFSTCSRQTNRHGQSSFGHFSRRANCFRLSRTKALSLNNSASRSVVSRCFPFIIMDLKPHTNPSCPACHLDRCGISCLGASYLRREQMCLSRRAMISPRGYRLRMVGPYSVIRGAHPARVSFERKSSAPVKRTRVRFWGLHVVRRSLLRLRRFFCPNQMSCRIPDLAELVLSRL